MMKLHSFWSPNPQKVRFAMAELGLPCEIAEVDLFAGAQKADAIRALNPMQKVPILEDGAVVLWESNAILCYLGDKTGCLWPGDPAALGRGAEMAVPRKPAPVRAGGHPVVQRFRRAQGRQAG